MIRKSSNRRPKKISRRPDITQLGIIALLMFSLAAIAIALRPETSQSKPTEPAIAIVNSDDMISLPTPVRQISRGERLSDVPFTTIKWPRSRFTEEYIVQLKDFPDAVATSTLPKYLPVPVSAIQKGPIDHNSVIEGIPAGMRAITVRVDAESAVEGWAQSGAYVDVILVRQGKESDGGLEAKIISENVRILSAGRSAEPASAGPTAPKAPSTATLLVTQEDALKIKAAANLGRLTFALRGFGDQSPAEALSVDQRNLLGGAKNALASKKELKGMARGPDGKVYVLSPGSRWTRTAELPDEFPNTAHRRTTAQEPSAESPTETMAPEKGRAEMPDSENSVDGSSLASGE